MTSAHWRPAPTRQNPDQFRLVFFILSRKDESSSHLIDLTNVAGHDASQPLTYKVCQVLETPTKTYIQHKDKTHKTSSGLAQEESTATKPKLRRDHLCVKALRKILRKMELSLKFAVVCVGISLLLSCQPIEAWYKQATGPSYYSVGRASGLLSGIRRSPYVRRSESEETVADSGETASNNVIPNDSRQISILKSMVSVQCYILQSMV